MTTAISALTRAAPELPVEGDDRLRLARPLPAGRAAVDLPRIERAVREILIAIGEDPEREGLRNTPKRVARAYAEQTAGLRADPRGFLRTVFKAKYDQVVLVRNISFHSMCEHHLMPFTGHAHVAYLPDGKVLGLSKIARLVDAFALRPQLQEQLTDQIADALMDGLQPRGAVCVVEATHQCMGSRGVKKEGSTMVTSAIRGVFQADAVSRGQVLALIYGASQLT